MSPWSRSAWGGRFDATNVCRPLVSLITSISYDHTRQLGPRLQDIAFEKSGIIKTGIPAISGATHVEARSVIEIICRQRNAPLLQLGRDFDFQYVPASITASSSRPARVTIRTPVRTWPTLQLGLLGEHQGANAAVTVACVEQLRKCGLPIPDQAVAEGLAGVVWPARLEVLRTQPFVILDCAHNVASAQALVDTLLASFPPSRRHLLFAGSKDKDIPGMFRVFAPHFVRCYLTRFTNNPRAASLEELQRIATAQKMTAQTYPTSQQAWEAASAQAAPDDLICITGSVFLAGEMRRILL
ncbi:MAG: hypothetical protein KatS3mg105_0699 [Gemmatales bacterium]|nr:MAG: hypothetical protein KatS3mg105_0699 [Gemmatales bacterium]